MSSIDSSSTDPTQSPLPSAGDDDERHESGVPAVGSRIAARFRLMRVLGSGGMGVVFEAHDETANELVALKWLRNRRHTESLRREFRALAGLSHPNLTEYFELFIEADKTFVTMERILGDPLDVHLRERRAEPGYLARVFGLFRQLAAAIGFLHDHGVVHCDLKPANVLVETSGQVRLVDFGIAQHPRFAPHAWLGTPAYAPPEVAARRQHGRPGDWYAFGVMLSEALESCCPPGGVAAAPELRPVLELCRALCVSSPESRAGYAQVATVLGVERPPRVDVEKFVGRESELGALKRAYAKCLTGGARWVDLRGASGVGKTRLMSRLLDELAELEAPPRTSWCTVYEHEHAPFRALSPFLSALSHWERSEPVALPPAQARTLDLLFSRGPHQNGHAARDDELHDWHEIPRSLGRLLRELGARRPILLVLDQLHLGDRDSAELLIAALQHQPRARVLVIAACRSDALRESEFLSATEGRLGAVPCERIELPPMTRTEIVTLLESRTSAPDAIADHANGLPFLALELAHARERGRDPARWLGERVDALSGGARALVRLLAICGHPLSLSTAQRALDAVAITLADVRALVRERLARETPERKLVIQHDRIAAALSACVAEPEARALHGALARALGMGAPVLPSPENQTLIAAHLFAAGRASEAVPYALGAADQAAQALSFGDEARWLRRVLDAGVPLPAPEERYRRRLAGALARSGRGDEAAPEYLLLASRASPLESRRDRCSAVEQLFKCGRRQQGREELERLTRDVGLPCPRSKYSALARLVWERCRLAVRGERFVERSLDDLDSEALLRADVASAARTGYMSFDLVGGAMFASLGLRLALEIGEPSRICRGLCDEILFRCAEGAPAAARVEPMIALCHDLASRTTRAELRSLARMAEGGTRLSAGRFGEAARLLGQTVRELELGPLSNCWELTYCRVLWITALEFHGPLHDGIPLLEQWMADAEARSDRAAAGFFAERPLAYLMADEAAAARVLRRRSAPLQAEEDYDHPRISAHRQRACVALYERAPTAELAELRPGLARFFRTSMQRSQGLRLTLRALLAGLDLEISARARLDRATLVRVERAIRALRSERTEYADALAATLVAAALHQQGNVKGALESLEQCQSSARACGWRFAALGAGLRRGQLLGGAAGRRVAEACSEALRELGVKRPSAYARVLLPGFREQTFAFGEDELEPTSARSLL